jgi:hypothetical protein
MASTKDVLNNHLKCFGEGNLKGILSDYAPAPSCSRRTDLHHRRSLTLFCQKLLAAEQLRFDVHSSAVGLALNRKIGNRQSKIT